MDYGKVSWIKQHKTSRKSPGNNGVAKRVDDVDIRLPGNAFTSLHSSSQWSTVADLRVQTEGERREVEEGGQRQRQRTWAANVGEQRSHQAATVEDDGEEEREGERERARERGDQAHTVVAGEGGGVQSARGVGGGRMSLSHPLLVAQKARHALEVKLLKDALRWRAGAGPARDIRLPGKGGPEQAGGAGPVSAPEDSPVVDSQQPHPSPPLHATVSETNGMENLNTLDRKAGSSQNMPCIID